MAASSSPAAAAVNQRCAALFFLLCVYGDESRELIKCGERRRVVIVHPQNGRCLVKSMSRTQHDDSNLARVTAKSERSTLLDAAVSARKDCSSRRHYHHRHSPSTVTECNARLPQYAPPSTRTIYRDAAERPLPADTSGLFARHRCHASLKNAARRNRLGSKRQELLQHATRHRNEAPR